VVIEWFKEANFSAVARRMKLSWERVDGIMSRAVARGLSRREACSPTRIGVDETSCQKRHEHATVVKIIKDSTVIAVMGGRTEESLGSFLGVMDEQHRAAITVAVMDMWPTYINAVKRHLPNAKIAFDRFQVAFTLPSRRSHMAFAWLSHGEFSWRCGACRAHGKTLRTS
jgi:transposase